ncbi:MAG: (d)CMP kinase [Maricaulaceae bacterium]
MRVIAIDGTFASGKGTLGRRVAAHYGFAYLDTGKLYRAVAQRVLTSGGDPDDAEQAVRAARAISASDLEDPILKSGPVGAAASKVAVHTDVRAALFDFQRDFAAQPQGAVLDGRDIGTVICPDADVKLYVDADVNIRAERRYKELLGYGEDVTLEGITQQLAERDARDQGRAIAPLKPAVDAHLLDTTNMSIDRAFAAAIAIIDAIIGAESSK